MGLFKKKKKNEEPPKMKTHCEMFGHLYQDLPWIMEDAFDGNAPSHSFTSRIELSEYYCCRICHHIKKEILWKSYERLSRKQHEEKKQAILQKYGDLIQPIPVVKDMINDMINVDREKLKIWEGLHEGE